MRHRILSLLVLVPALSALAQPIEPPRRVLIAPEAQSEWTILRSASPIELLPELRIRVAPPTGGQRVQKLDIKRSSAQEPSINLGQYGVVFNHAMQAYGALTGEVSFRADGPAAADVAAQAAGLKNLVRMGSSDYYVGHAHSPEQLRDALQRLRALPSVQDAQWVVIYDLLPRAQVHAARMAVQ